MKGPLTTLAICLTIVVGTLGYGLWERHIGAQAVEARVRAESLLVVAKTAQDSILRADSAKSAQYDSAAAALRRSLEAARAHYARSRGMVDSLISATRSDSMVPGDSVAALVSAFQGERVAADSQIAALAADTLLLTHRLATKDSTIAALNHSLDGERQQLATALRPHSPGVLSRGFDVATKTLALYGLGKLVFH